MRKHILTHFPAFLALGIGIFFIVFSILGQSFAFLPGDLIDGRFNNYILEHDFQFFTGQISNYWSAPFMYPAQHIITYSDNLLGSAPIYSFFRLIGYEKETAFQAWYLMMFVLNFVCCYLFLLWLFKNNYSAIVGAFIFAFSLAIQSQVSHVQVFPRYALPIIFWMFFLFIKEFNPKYYFFMLLSLVYQFYCAIYLGFLSSIPLVIMFTIAAIKNRTLLYQKLKSGSWRLKILFYSTINIGLLSILMYPYLKYASHLSVLNTFERALSTLPTVVSYYYSFTGSLCWQWLSKTGKDLPARWDHQIFAGGIATLSVLLCLYYLAAGIFRTKKNNYNSELCLLAFAGIITFFLFLRIGNFSLYKAIYHIPGFSSMRSMARIINIELIFYAIAGSWCYNFLQKKYPRFKLLLIVLVLPLLTIDNYAKSKSIYRTEKSITQTRLKLLEEKLQHVPVNSIISYEPIIIDDSSTTFNTDAMLACQALHLKCVNGYSGNSPGAYTPFWMEPNTINRRIYFSAMNYNSDTIYVVTNDSAIFIETQANKNRKIDPLITKFKIDSLTQIIIHDEKWFKSIKLKAVEKNLTLDSMLVLDAVWMLNQR